MERAKANQTGAKWTVLGVVLLAAVVLLVAHGDKLPALLQKAPAGDCVLVHFIDVGQGEATLIQSGKEGILIDAGEREYADRVISYIRRSGVKTLPFVVATHPHTDHIGALPDVLQAFAVGAVIQPRLTDETTPVSYTYEALLQTIREKQIRMVAAKPGKTYTLQNATLRILAPLAQVPELNNMSVVCSLTAFHTVFLLTADAEIAAQETLLHASSDLRCDILQAPHHGSSGALYPPFWDAAAPQAAVISCGRNNDYGHPNAAVLQYLNEHRIEVYRTDLQSDIVVRCSKDGYRIDTDD